MAFFISRRQVFNNLMRVKQGLDGQMHPSDQDKRIYRAMLNYQTGDIQFSTARLHDAASSDWKEIEFEVKNKKGSSGFFEAKDLQNNPLEANEMTPIAWRVMVETIKALNELTAQHSAPNMRPEQVAIQCIESEISSPRSIEIIPGWAGEINRMKAERMLNSKEIGSYLLRNGDSFTQVIAKNLMEGNKMDVEVFVCTLVEPEGKISDILILMTSNGWAFYRDNPDLLDSEYVYHDSPEALLVCLGKRLKHPAV